MQTDIIFDNTLGMLFGIESEGFLTIDDGKNCYYAGEWLPGSGKLGCDGRADTVEYRSVPFIKMSNLKEDIKIALESHTMPDECKLIFAAHAENTQPRGRGHMPCGLHITYSVKDVELINVMENLYNNGKFQKYIEKRYPLNEIMKFEGEMGRKRRDCSHYGNYEDRAFQYRSSCSHGFNGIEYRVFSSCMSDMIAFDALVGSYMWFTWIYMWIHGQKKIHDFDTRFNIDPELTEIIKDYKMYIVGRNAFSTSCYNRTLETQFEPIRDSFKKISEVDICECLRTLSSSAREMEKHDIYTLIKANKKNGKKCCKKCLRTSCQCPVICSRCNNEYRRGTNMCEDCGTCHNCCQCVECSCGTTFTTESEYLEHTCNACGNCPEDIWCSCVVCSHCNTTVEEDDICNGCNVCNDCCSCIVCDTCGMQISELLHVCEEERSIV